MAVTMTPIHMITTMTDALTLLRLQTWFSPAFPIGAFSYSHGLEAAIDWGADSTREEMFEWLYSLLSHGPGWNDAIFLAQAWQSDSDQEGLEDLTELATALVFSKERLKETTEQGQAFAKAAAVWRNDIGFAKFCPLPIVVGATAGALKIELKSVLTAFLHAYLSNQVQAALRLMKLGQQEGVSLLADLEKPILQTAEKALSADLTDLASNTFMADIVAMQHETLASRIFIS